MNKDLIRDLERELAEVVSLLEQRIHEAAQREAALRDALTYSPPPGPPDPRWPTTCPGGHLLHWITLRVAYCPEIKGVGCVWHWIPGRPLREIVDPTVLSVVLAVKRALTAQEVP